MSHAITNGTWEAWKCPWCHVALPRSQYPAAPRGKAKGKDKDKGKGKGKGQGKAKGGWIWHEDPWWSKGQKGPWRPKGEGKGVNGVGQEEGCGESGANQEPDVEIGGIWEFAAVEVKDHEPNESEQDDQNRNIEHVSEYLKWSDRLSRRNTLNWRRS